jgi:hypothetical protein
LSATAAAYTDIPSGNFFTILFIGGFQMGDIIDFKDRRKQKLGKQNETEADGFDRQKDGTLSSGDESQENIDSELAAEL